MKTELIFALDVPDRKEAQRLIKLLGGEVSWHKIGLELFLREGAGLVERMADQGKKVFLDLKLHDIPRTVGKSVLQVGSVGASMMTIHAAGGSDMIQAAAEAAKRIKKPLKIIAVTVLTSLDAQALKKIGIKRNPGKWAVELAYVARRSGADGVVASPREIKAIKAACGTDFIVITPGIRMPDSPPDDQRRTATPSLAARMGADFIVVGRPIREAVNPVAAAREIKKMIAGPLKRR